MIADSEFTGDDWTPDEQALLASLPHERIPPSELKARTTDALRRRGLLHRQPAARRTRALTFIAAAAAIFVAGTLVGYVAANRSVKASDGTRTATRQDVAEVTSPTSNNPPTRHVVWY
jgi:hypothetical protein